MRGQPCAGRGAATSERPQGLLSSRGPGQGGAGEARAAPGRTDEAREVRRGVVAIKMERERRLRKVLLRNPTGTQASSHARPALRVSPKGAFLQLQSRPDEEAGSQGPAGPGGGHRGAQSRLPPPLPWALAGWQKAAASTLGAAGGGGSDKAALHGVGGDSLLGLVVSGPRACLRTQEVLTRVCQPREPCLLPPHPSV